MPSMSLLEKKKDLENVCLIPECGKLFLNFLCIIREWRWLGSSPIEINAEETLYVSINRYNFILNFI